MAGRDLAGKGGRLCATPPSEREGTTGFFCIKGCKVMGFEGWGLVSEQVKERLRGVGTGGRSGSLSAGLEEHANIGSGGVRWSFCWWSWSLPRPWGFPIEPYRGLSNISDPFSSSPLQHKGSGKRDLVSLSTKSNQLLFVLFLDRCFPVSQSLETATEVKLKQALTGDKVFL